MNFQIGPFIVCSPQFTKLVSFNYKIASFYELCFMKQNFLFQLLKKMIQLTQLGTTAQFKKCFRRIGKTNPNMREKLFADQSTLFQKTKN